MNRHSIALVCVFALAGCTEQLRRGEPGSPNYIAPDYRACKVVAFEPELFRKAGGRTGVRQAYSVIQDDRGRRYRKLGRVGEVGDEFQMDVSLSEEIK
jgi:hypothetical protein